MPIEGVLGTVSEFIMVDGPESISQCVSVHCWVESVTSAVEDGQMGPILTSELLLGQIFYKI